MLFFTNRTLLPAATDETAFSDTFVPMADTLGHATVTGTRDANGKARWALTDLHANHQDDAMLSTLVTHFQGNKPVLLYVHGFNKPPRDAFERCLRLEELYNVSALGFSWTSEGLQPDGTELSGLDANRAETDDGEGALSHLSSTNVTEGWISRKIRRYRQAKANAQDTTYALARFLRLVAVARLYAQRQPLTIAVHSLGCHMLQRSIEIEGVQSALSSATNVLLLAACTSRERHADWVGKINPTSQLFITFNQGDTVLGGAQVADSGDIKLGTAPGENRVRSPKARYIDFERSQVGLGGHSYFAAPFGKKPGAAAHKLFERLFTSQRDFAPGTNPKPIYPIGCNDARTECYMGAPVIGN